MLTAPPPPATTPPPPPPPPAVSVEIPEASSWEYTRSWLNHDTNVYSAWQSGTTGEGVTVAVIDSGIDLDHPDLSVNISPLSTDINTERNNPEGTSMHGTRVASIIAAPFNGTGTVGIAFNAEILSVRTDTVDNNNMFNNADLARGIAYAVDNGAKIINLSLGGESKLNAAFEAALEYGIERGAVFTMAAGNKSSTNPQWPARYATDPRFSGSIIIVGAHSEDGTMADFSNKAGVGMDSYISAPGDDVVTDCREGSCWSVDGTSFASPAVAGAMALLNEAFPNLTGREIVEILLRTAADAGDTGTDIVWGRGKLDIAAAFRPVGATSTPSATSATPVGLGTPPGAYVGGPFGDALGRTTGLA
ncbi:S8 family peptidase, partial [Brevundimonas pishanensis]|uniref:S8 family peptidase n=1 Tax=Brevundimonas pishanensis TaxID=2896315 RepID=UPI001FA712B4